MLQTRTTSAFFHLLQAGLWEHKAVVSTIFPLSDQEWNLIHQISIQQTVEAIIYDGIQHLPSSQKPSRQLLLKWIVRIEFIERRNKAMNKIITDQAQFFKTNQLEPILLKGQGIAQYYPNPLHRICGDIDWYFSTKAMYDKANKLVIDKGFDLIKTAGYSSSYLLSSFEIEHHQRLFDIHNPFCKSFLKKLAHSEQEKKCFVTINNLSIAIPEPINNIVQVNSHILKHLLSFGIGIRQLCDSARLYHSMQNHIDPDELHRIYFKLGIEKWIQQLHHVLVHYIGLPEKHLPFKLLGKPTDWLIIDILRSGNFGFHDARYIQEEQNNNGSRAQVKNRLWHSFKTYLPFAPMEAISFPIVHFLSRFSR